MEKVCIVGAGGHAKVIFDIIQKSNQYIIDCVFAKNIGEKKEFFGAPLYEQDELFESNIQMGIVAIGDNWIRSRVVELIKSKKKNFNFIKAIHPQVIIGQHSIIGEGTVIMPGSVVGPDSKIGNHCIINTSSSIDHDCKILDFASIAPGATLGGNVSVGSYSAISLGANIIHGIKIGDHSVIGSGSTVITDIESYKTAYGLPCKEIRERKVGDSYL
jgi:sugar O-acyltransferase (sialic acid O-acetyltransferase NeuD family)